MTDVYLRAEAVNLANVITDTEDLSTIRGGGLMVLDLSKPVEAALRQSAHVAACNLITHGASQTVFRVSLKPGSTGDDIVAGVDRALRRDELLRFATIAVDAVAVSDDYGLDRERLLALNRLRQLRQSRVSPAGAVAAHAAAGDRLRPWCPVDMVRPAAVAAEHVRNQEKAVVSESVAARRQYGFVHKQKAFYKEQAGWEPAAGIAAAMEIAWDLHQIAEFDGDVAAKLREHANLNGKIAVLHIDGNKFGTLQAELCRDEADQKKWDDRVQTARRRALKTLLDDAWQAEHPDWHGAFWWNRADPKHWRLRLETLQWGGDEVLWVVPAWLGWQVVQTFFQVVSGGPPDKSPAAPQPAARPGPLKHEIRNLDIKPKKVPAPAPARDRPNLDQTDLTYSAGLVFCHAQAPIRRIWNLAEDLTREAKEAGAGRQNAIAYVVLESFDQLGRAVKAARIRHLPFPATVDADVLRARLSQTAIDAAALPKLLDAVRWMREHFPRGSVYRILGVLREEEETWTEKAQFKTWFSRALNELTPAQQKQAREHLALFDLGQERTGRNAAARINWLHLAELWDYVI